MAIWVYNRVADHAQGVTWAQLARLCGMRRHTYYAWGAGRALPSLASLYTVSKALGISIYDLVPRK